MRYGVLSARCTPSPPRYAWSPLSRRRERFADCEFKKKAGIAAGLAHSEVSALLYFTLPARRPRTK